MIGTPLHTMLWDSHASLLPAWLVFVLAVIAGALYMYLPDCSMRRCFPAGITRTLAIRFASATLYLSWIALVAAGGWAAIGIVPGFLLGGFLLRRQECDYSENAMPRSSASEKPLSSRSNKPS